MIVKKEVLEQALNRAIDKKHQAWQRWWLQWPSGIAEKEFKTAFFAGYEEATKESEKRIRELESLVEQWQTKYRRAM